MGVEAAYGVCGVGESVMGERRLIAWGSRSEGRDRTLIRDGNHQHVCYPAGPPALAGITNQSAEPRLSLSIFVPNTGRHH